MEAYAKEEGRLSEIVDKVANKNNFLELVLSEILQEAENSDNINQKVLLDIDLAIVKGHPDSNVFLLFIYVSILYFYLNNLLEKTRSLYSIGVSTISEKNHPDIHICMLDAKAKLKGLEGNKQEQKQLMKEIIFKINKNSPRFYRNFFNYSVLYAELGILKELSKFELEMLEVKQNEKQAFNNTLIKIVNNIMIGEYKEGLEEIEEYRKIFKTTDYYEEFFSNATNELSIVSGDFNPSNYTKDIYVTYVSAYNSLLSSKLDETVKLYNIIIENKFQNKVSSQLFHYLPFHIELSLGKIGMVRLWLKEKKEKGNWHYIDDLFYGRLHLLEKNYAKADDAFIRLMENINRYGAMNRLIFEIQFAKEMKLSDILLLMQGWNKQKNTSMPNPKKDSARLPKSVAKGYDQLIGNSKSILKVKELINKYAPLKAPVLVTGETGTGKELVSRAIHDVGPNNKDPFIEINCGALTESLLQSELFGYVAGAFTGAQREHKGIFEAAGKGTVFLDEFGDISPLLQVSLLRVLESNEIRMLGATTNCKIECRIIIATNTNLQNAVSEKKFREDLYFRITRFEIKLPSLRERVEDLPMLADYFLNRDNESYEKPKIVSKELLDALSTYRWPGNIRELKNEMERLKILHFEKEILNIENFAFNQLQGYIPQKPNLVSSSNTTLDSKNSPPTEKTSFDVGITSDYVVNIIQRGSKVERRINFIKELFIQYKKLTRSQIIEIAKVNPSTATKELQMLCDEGFIVRHTPTKSSSTFYFEIATDIK
jgi:DNA-binding NtrC family response regulator